MTIKTFIIWGGLLISAHAAIAAPLKLATTPWPPFTGEKNEPRIVIELVEEALQRSGITATVTVVPEAFLTGQLQEKKFDGSPAMWRAKERETFLNYSVPLLENRLVLVGKKGSDVSAKKLTDLKGKRVGIVTGYAYGEEVAQAKETIFVKGTSEQANVEKLLRGELDFALMEELLLQHLIAEQGEDVKAHMQIGTAVLITRSLHFTLRKDVPKSAEIIQKFNANLNSLLADGTYNRILKLNWIQADVDGDGKLELIPRTNKIGKTAPSSNYVLFHSSRGETSPSQSYYIDGHMYSDWENVPVRYKTDELSRREKSDPFLKLKF